MLKMTDRKCFNLVALLCVIAMAIVLYLQFAQGLLPCPLCVFQRVGVIGAFIFAVIGAIVLFQRFWRIVWYILILIPLCFGLLAAARQVWLQHLPPGQVTACGPGLNILLQELPLHQAIVQVFYGSGSCAVVHLWFMGLNIAEWSLVFFVALILITLWGLIAGKKRHSA